MRERSIKKEKNKCFLIVLDNLYVDQNDRLKSNENTYDAEASRQSRACARSSSGARQGFCSERLLRKKLF